MIHHDLVILYGGDLSVSAIDITSQLYKVKLRKKQFEDDKLTNWKVGKYWVL